MRFQGSVVTRLEIMTVDGEKIVRTQKEVDLPSQETEVAKKTEPEPNRPMLLRCEAGRATGRSVGHARARPPATGSHCQPLSDLRRRIGRLSRPDHSPMRANSALLLAR